MNKYLAGSLIFLAGCGIGFGVSYVIQKKIFGSQKSEEKQPENEEIVENEANEPRKFDFTEQMNRRKEELRKRERIAYDKIPQPYDDLPENEVDEVEMMINNDDPTGDIKIITGDMFAHDHLGYDDETLLWWENNNLMSTEDYEIVDIPDLIGTAWKDRIGEFEPNVVYVINHAARMKYEIVRQTEDYYDYQS